MMKTFSMLQISEKTFLPVQIFAVAIIGKIGGIYRNIATKPLAAFRVMVVIQ